MGYPNRRYRVVDGKLVKRWDAPGDGWFVTKAEAWADDAAKAKTFAANNARRESAKKQRDAKAEKAAAKVAKKAEAKKAAAKAKAEDEAAANAEADPQEAPDPATTPPPATAWQDTAG